MRKKMRKIGFASAGLMVALLCLSNTAWAAGIGVNFVNYRINTQTNLAGYVLLPTESAGVVSQQNWNNYSASNDTDGRIEWDPYAGISGEWVRDITSSTYIDSAGSDTGLSVSYDIGGDVYWSVYSADNSSDGDTKLMSGNALAVNDISLSNVPYTTYDLIVYVAGQIGQTANQSVTVSGDDFTNITKYVEKANSSTTIHTESDSTASGTYEVGTYVRFIGLSGDSSISIGSENYNIATGFQVVPVAPTDALETMSVPADAAGNVDYSFRMTRGEVPVKDYIQFLNSADSAGEVEIAEGEVSDAATGKRYCLTTQAEAESYLLYDVDQPAGERFASVVDKKDHPMIFVSWFGAAAYCNWESTADALTPVYQPGSGWTADMAADGYRLPTEKEWYKAAAWNPEEGRYTEYGTGEDEISGDNVNYLHSGDDSENNSVSTSPVLEYFPDNQSYYGISDASGNAWEWCHGFFSEDGADEDVDPHAVRGGSWGNLKQDVRTDSRCGFKPHMAVSTAGFRYLTTAVPE